MKNNNLLIILFLLILNGVNAQFFISPRCITNPDLYADSCETPVVIEALNAPAGGTVIWRQGLTNVDTEKFIGDTIPNFCYTEDQLLYTFNNDIILYARTVLPNFKFQVTAYQAPSSTIAPDGFLEITFDSIQTFFGPSFFNNLTQSGEIINYTTTDSITFTLDNLYYGLIYLQIPLLAEYFPIFIGDVSNNLVNNALDININTTDTDQNCNGTILLTPTNSVGNVQYFWGYDNSATGPFQENLCPGIYSVYAIDQNQQQSIIEVSVVDTTNTNIYTDSSVFYYVAGDTVYYDFLNCDIDFTNPIDSIHYFENILTPISADTLAYLFLLTIYQDTNIYEFSDTLFISLDSNIYFETSIYCQQVKALFSGKRINFIRHGDVSTTASLSEKENKNSISIYPNPTEDFLTIAGKFSKGTVTDMSGRIVLYFDSNEISLTPLTNGIYYIKLDESSDIFIVMKQ